MKPTRKNLFLAIAGSTALTVSYAQAQSNSWLGDAAGDWGDGTKWTGGTTPADGAQNTATFGNVITAARIINLDSARTIGNITASDTSHDYTISGANILTLDRTDATKPTINVTQSGRVLTISSQISGSDGLLKSGAGILTLSGNNNFSGGITLGAGTLRLTGAAPTFTGGVIINAGALGDNTGNVTPAALNGNAITVNGNASIGSQNTATVYTSNVTITAGLLTLANNNGSSTWSGQFTGAGGIVVGQLGLGSNSVNLTGLSNNFTGGVDYSNTTGGTAQLNVNSFADSASSGAGNIRFGVASGAGAHAFNYGSGATTSLTLANRQFNLAGTGPASVQINNNSSQAFTISSNTANAGTGTRTLTLGGTGAGLSTFSGNITNGTLTTLNVTKGGAATSNTWVLSGDNSFNGLLTLTGSTAASTSSVLTLSGDNIGMTGGVTINGNATAGVGGARLNINSPTAIGTGTLSFGANPSTIANTSGAAITLTTNNAMAWNQNFTFATGSDLNMGTGAVTLGGNRAITTGSTLTVGGVISDGVSDFGITKGGAGGLTLSGLNSYSGKTSVNQGTLSINTIGNVGAGDSSLGNPTTVANGTINLGSSTLGGTLLYTGTTTSTNRVIDLSGTTGGAALNMSGTGTLTFTSNFTATGSGAKTLTLTGSTAGTGEIQGAIVDSASATALTKTGTGTWILTGNNTFTGTVTVNNGVLDIRHSNALGSAAKTVSIVGNGASSLIPELQLQNNISVAMTTLNVSGNGVAGGGVLRNISGNNTITATNINLAGGNGGSEFQSDAGLLTLNGDIAATSTLRNLTLDGSGNGLINGIISDGSTVNLPLTKNGNGTWTLTGNNTYTGTTTVSGGTLLINGNSSTAIGAVAVNGGTLGGNGTLGGAVTVGAATLAPGTSPGTLTIANALVLNSTSILAWELNAADQTVGSNINDLVTGVTDLTLDGTINVTSATLLTGTWRLFNYTGTLFNNTINLGTIDVGSGLTASIDTATAGQVNLVVIPEPNVAALIGALGGILLLRRRR